MGELKQDRGGIGNWITDRILRSLIGLARALPYPRRIRFAGAAFRHFIGPLAGYRRRAMDHLAYIHPNMPKLERRHLADRIIDNAGRTLIENYSSRAFSARMARTEISGVGLAAIEQAKADSRPVIFVTGHFGNYEAPRNALQAHGFTVGGLYRPMSNPYFNSHYVKTMEAVSGPMFEQGRRGTMGFARHLKAGGMAVLLFDLWDRAGTPVSFLGKSAPTSTSAAEIAIKFNALVVPYFGVRQPDGLEFDVIIEAPIDHSDPITMTQDITKRLEAQIALNPEQWFWFHRRWKPERKL